ncbi:hypothetical protein CSUI_007341 [Cystoisospora suis]|uniref:Transmembrane protein n=1 Tax=Cystoisospora suis TaxID=483139 RepID=A0A2C6KQY6_9APIC|nr:hypothetical protein CSUI_007341 [Cystoisospora suis]
MFNRLSLSLSFFPISFPQVLLSYLRSSKKKEEIYLSIYLSPCRLSTSLLCISFLSPVEPLASACLIFLFFSSSFLLLLLIPQPHRCLSFCFERTSRRELEKEEGMPGRREREIVFFNFFPLSFYGYL